MPSRLALILVVLLAAPFLLAADAPTTVPAIPWPRIAEMLGVKGTERESVYTITVPRGDLAVSTPDAGEVPTAAGLESTFHFYLCPCGKTNVVGTFLVAEYESNDVIDALRAGGIHVVSVAPAFYNETPRVMTVRFQGEGQTDPIAGAIKEALGRTGEARNPKIVIP
jgi:hypothetical protein